MFERSREGGNRKQMVSKLVTSTVSYWSIEEEEEEEEAKCKSGSCPRNKETKMDNGQHLPRKGVVARRQIEFVMCTECTVSHRKFMLVYSVSFDMFLYIPMLQRD